MSFEHHHSFHTPKHIDKPFKLNDSFGLGTAHGAVVKNGSIEPPVGAVHKTF